MKRGNLNLSINSIVVLILAITMLGLGLAFMRNIFGDATDQFAQVSEEMRTEMANKMKGISAPMDLNIHEVDVTINDHTTIYMGIRNDQGSVKQFDIIDVEDIGLASCHGGSLGNILSLNYPTGERYIQANDVDVIPIRINGEGEGRCRLEFVVKQDGDRIGTRNIYVYVG